MYRCICKYTLLWVEKNVMFEFLKLNMNKYYFLLPIVAILLTSSCEKTEAVVTPEIIVEAKPAMLLDSISFVLNGKQYGFTSDDYIAVGSGHGNEGVNLRLSDTSANWSHSGPDHRYWIGAPDSVQYYSVSNYSFGDRDITARFYFIKNNRISEMLKSGGMYYPRKSALFYQERDYNYAVDFGRRGKQEGVALRMGVKGVGFGSTFSSKTMNQESKLTAESQLDSKFKILKVEEIKDSNFVWIEGTFDANLFNDNEEKSFRVTGGYFRIRVLKYGNGFTYGFTV